MNQNNIAVSIETKAGRPIRTYSHEGRTYIESHENLEYRVRVKNKTGKRIKACISVDGVSIVTGKSISDKPEETGYIIGPYGDELFKGYRVDENTVAEFKFVKKEASYATEQGVGQGNGVVAVRAWVEKAPLVDPQIEELRKKLEEYQKRPREKEYISYPVYPSWPKSPCPDPNYYCKLGGTVTWGGMANNVTYTSNMCCNSVEAVTGSIINSPKPSTSFSAQAINVCDKGQVKTVKMMMAEETPFEHGSSWGGAIQEKVIYTTFEVGTLLEEVIIYYAPLEGLKSLGVNVTKDKQVAFPEPFKREWATPPKNWNSGQAPNVWEQHLQ
jgi:hypothetical protein